jgi:hypothetical protein
MFHHTHLYFEKLAEKAALIKKSLARIAGKATETRSLTSHESFNRLRKGSSFSYLQRHHYPEFTLCCDIDLNAIDGWGADQEAVDVGMHLNLFKLIVVVLEEDTENAVSVTYMVGDGVERWTVSGSESAPIAHIHFRRLANAILRSDKMNVAEHEVTENIALDALQIIVDVTTATIVKK